MDWTKALHYAAGVALLGLGLAGAAGVALPGVQIDPVTALGAAIGFLTAGRMGPSS